MKKTIAILMCVLFITIGHTQDFRKLDAYYNKALKDWNVPGMSIAIVKDGKIVFSKGYGVKDTDKAEPTDEHTLYAIASNSKAFTAAAIGQLVDEKKVSWTDKVRTYLPYFELYDPYVSHEATISDLLCHRVGLGTFSGDLIWYRSTLDQEGIIRRVKHLPQDYGFRAGYGYSNVMYITAGEVMRKVTGKSWGENIQERFLQPLGMTRTIYTTKDLDKKGNYAMPHALIGDDHRPLPWEDWETVGATGGIISSAKDMAQWMIFNLSHGVWKGDTLLSLSSRNTIWMPHNMFTVNYTSADKTTHFRGYGLGWSLSDYHGKLRVGHTGGYSGMTSGIALIPDENLGVVVLTNGMKPIYAALINYTLDVFLKQPHKDWSREGLASFSSRQKTDTRIEDRKKARRQNTTPSLPPSGYTGEYASDSYGKITVRLEGGKLKLYFEHTPDLTSTLEHWHYDVWQIKWDKPELLPWFTFGTIKFNLDNNGSVTGIAFDVPNDDFFFEELNARRVQ